MLIENGELILNNKKIANTFNDHFISIVYNLDLDHWDDHTLSPMTGSNRIDNHASIKNIKAKVNSFHSFYFQPLFMKESGQLFEI